MHIGMIVGITNGKHKQKYMVVARSDLFYELRRCSLPKSKADGLRHPIVVQITIEAQPAPSQV